MTCLCAFVASICLLGPVEPAVATEQPAADLVSSRISGRVLKHFDFDERPLGNYESMPKGWRPMGGPGFPRFAESQFDFKVGHDRAPSLRFDLAGGNVGAVYIDESIDVHPDSDYEISAWIRTSGLCHAGQKSDDREGLEFARAFVSGVLVDHSLRELEDSRCTSEMVAGSEGNWQEVRIRLKGGFAKARWLGLSCQVEQISCSAGSLRPIERKQVRGSVWFDDIVVTRLPRTELEMKNATGVFFRDEPAVCRVGLRDIDASDLDCRLYVRNGNGDVLAERTLKIPNSKLIDMWVELGALRAGWYEAALEVRSGSRLIVKKQHPFVRLAGSSQSTEPSDFRGSGFGLICEPLVAGQEILSGQLIAKSGAAACKIPLWWNMLGDEEILRGSSNLYEHLQRLDSSGVRLIGVLDAVPAGLMRAWQDANRGESMQSSVSVATVLACPVEQWRAYVALPVTRYGRFFERWQVGGEFEDNPAADVLMRGVEALRNEFPSLKLMHAPAQASGEDSDFPLAWVPGGVSAATLGNLPCFNDSKGRHADWVSVEPADESMPRDARLSEFSQKLIMARCLGAKIVFSPQPWTISRYEHGWAAAPRDQYVIQRTLSHALSGMSPVQQVATTSDTIAWLWANADGSRGALTAWASADGAEVEMELDVGGRAQQIDLSGNTAALSSTSTGQILRLSPMPIIVAPIDPHRVMLAAGMRLGPARLMAGMEQSLPLTLKNPLKQSLRGELELRAAGRWHVFPARLQIDLPPGGTLTSSVSIRVPINEPSGETVVMGRFLRPGDALNGLYLRTPTRIEPQGLDVNVMSRAEGDGLRIFQRVSNLNERSIRLKSFAVADGQRIGGGAFELAAGQSIVREYLLGAETLGSGVPVRVSLEQVDGPVRDNRILHLASK